MSLSDLQSRIAVIISADGSGAIREIQKVGQSADKDLGKATENIDKLGNRLTYGGAAAMGFAAMAGGALYSFAKASDEAHQYEVKLQNSMRNSPVLANANIESFKKLAQAIQGKTAADGDQILGSMAVLAQFRLTEQQIKTVTPLVVDYARKMGVDLDTAAKNVGKALDGKATALQKSGIKLDENIYKTDRLTAVVNGLRGTVGGFAEQEGQTFSGKLERFKNQMNDLKESIGSGVISTIGPLASGLGKVAQGASEVNDKTGGMVGTIASVGVGVTGAVGALSFMSGQFIKLREQMVAAEGGMTAFGAAASGIALIGLGFVIFEAMNKLEDSFKAAKIDVEQLHNSVQAYASDRQLTGELQKQIDDYKHLSEAIGVYSQRNDQMVKDSQHWWGAIANGTESYYLNTISIDEAKDKLGKLDDQLAQLQQSGNTAAASDLFQKVSDAAQRGGSSIEDINQAFPKYKASINNTTEANNAAIDRYHLLGKTIEDANLSLTEFIEKNQKMATTNVELELGNLRLKESYEKVVQTTGNGTLATDEAKRSSDEFSLSLFRQAESQANAAVSNSNAQNESEKARIKNEALIKALIDLKGQYGIVGGQVDDFIKTLQRQPGEVTTTVRVNTEDMSHALDQARARFDGLMSHIRDSGAEVNFHINGGGNTSFRALGGPVMAGQAYVVGERGPELMVPNANGTIIPNNALRAYNPGSSTYNVTVNVASGTHPADVGSEVVNAIKAYERRNGTAWRN